MQGRRGTPGAQAPCALAIYADSSGYRGAAAEGAAAVAVAPATASGWAATRLAQPLRMASAWADAICPAVNRAGGRLASLHETRACKKRMVQGDRESSGTRTSSDLACDKTDRAWND